MPRESGAEPYHDFNAKITAECYRPNALLGNFERVSFNVGPTLIQWLSNHDKMTYGAIVEADQRHRQKYGVGNAVAQPVHHSILPLDRRRDKITQIAWGIASFDLRFGRKPHGMWLPEMAVDLETLEVLAAAGIRFTILSDEQVQGDLAQGAGPYLVKLGRKQSIAVFVRDRFWSNQLSFDIGRYQDASVWGKMALSDHKKGLKLLATDGETFGHHHRGAEHFLHDLLWRDLPKSRAEVTTLERYLDEHPPKIELDITEYSSWSCGHGVQRWLTGCECTPGDSRWKGSLRRALDIRAGEIDRAYAQVARECGAEPWELRDGYIEVRMGKLDGPAFLAAHGLGHLDSDAARRLLLLLQAQFYRQRMYASCAFFFEELTRFEPRYAIANAAKAIVLVEQATGVDLAAGFRRDLAVVVSTRVGVTGADLYDAIVESARSNGCLLAATARRKALCPPSP
ncbi:MAG: DUF3536 domain-containing protein [Thermoflexales bacterium]|nr:DUF3536 domain-containing protein [Thermoflexales bacterium]